ncbi:hypothetical protein [Streptomyces sp. NPDC017435]|uniref:hypothetical protein n=1 Tax=Streptomyces sp. NPDC017435 TaxID=3364995 RepID=UPI00378878E5
MQVKAPDRATIERPAPADRPAPRPPASAPLLRSRTVQGLGYAAPTAVFVAVFFVLPLLLVGQMSLSDWPLLAGDRGVNAPENFTDATDGALFWPAVRFTLLYTVIVTVVLLDDQFQGVSDRRR